jgi:phosphate starvation-inducible PhoH-like protein
MREKKNDIKYLISLNEEQKKAKTEILESVASAIYGAAGSGKSLLAAQIALDQLFLYEKKIIIVRPAVTAHEDIGFLKGSADEKMALFTQPTHQNMYKLYNKAKIDKEILEGNIIVIPVGYTRGYTFQDCTVIVEEAQNLTFSQTELLLGRIGKDNCRMIFCGDSAQIDLKNKKESGFDFICKHLVGIEKFCVIKLKQNHRHSIVEEILEVFKKYQ